MLRQTVDSGWRSQSGSVAEALLGVTHQEHVMRGRWGSDLSHSFITSHSLVSWVLRM